MKSNLVNKYLKKTACILLYILSLSQNCLATDSTSVTPPSVTRTQPYVLFAVDGQLFSGDQEGTGGGIDMFPHPIYMPYLFPFPFPRPEGIITSQCDPGFRPYYSLAISTIPRNSWGSMPAQRLYGTDWSGRVYYENGMWKVSGCIHILRDPAINYPDRCVKGIASITVTCAPETQI